MCRLASDCCRRVLLRRSRAVKRREYLGMREVDVMRIVVGRSPPASGGTGTSLSCKRQALGMSLPSSSMATTIPGYSLHLDAREDGRWPVECTPPLLSTVCVTLRPVSPWTWTKGVDWKHRGGAAHVRSIAEDKTLDYCDGFDTIRNASTWAVKQAVQRR